MARVLQGTLTRIPGSKSKALKAIEHLPVKSDRKVVLLKVDDIDWIESAHNYVTLRLGKRSHLMRGTLDSIELRLPTDRFVRISRFYIVQIDRIKEFELFDSGDCRVTLHTGTRLTLSRRYRVNFQKRGLL
jgi:two-component system LytT family response regulator